MRRAWCLAVALTGWPAVAGAQRLGGGAGTVDLSVGRVLAALVVCVAAALALALLVRARGGGRLPVWPRLRAGWAASPRIRVIETRRAGVHADACLIECDGDQYLLVCGPSVQTVLRAPERSRVV